MCDSESSLGAHGARTGFAEQSFFGQKHSLKLASGFLASYFHLDVLH